MDLKRWLHRWAVALLMLIGLGFSPLAAPAGAALPPGNAVKDPAAILRNALPIQQKDLEEIQHRLESTSDDLRAKRWSALVNTVRRSQTLLSSRSEAILASLPAEQQGQGSALLEDLSAQMQVLAESSESSDRDRFLADRRTALSTIGELEALMVGEFPFTIPSEFDNLPRLLGRATVEIETSQGTLIAIADGYNAPLTAGAFIDLVQKGFYDGLPFTRAEDFYVLQTGDPKGPESGYIDPKTKVERKVPLEIMVPGEPLPFYNETFEDLGRFEATPVLPFATLGTMGWAHSDEALDDGSSQFFFFLYEAELTPAGLNLVDGRYGAFGYVVDGFDVLEELGINDGIVRARVIEGADNLKPHA
ncbi:MAG: peptidylprolyl isomerase [Vulcanococcus sp.]|jgi:peptidylprolyl isomerase